MVTDSPRFYTASMMVVFTDLDGTLLDHHTYSFEPALVALQRLRELDVPVVFVTSKTFPEVEFWRRELNNHSPFVVENGAAVFAPKGHPTLPQAVTGPHEEYEMVEFGVSYGELTGALKDAARDSGCRVQGFADMSAGEVSRSCQISLEQATLAKARRYDEAFRLIEGDVEALQRAIERRGMRLTRGGRFFHVTGQNDKAGAVFLLIRAYRRLGSVETIGIGDGPNDIGFLHLVDHAVLLDSPLFDEVRNRVPYARTAASGPEGWNEAILELLKYRLHG